MCIRDRQADYDNGEKLAILASLVLWDCSPSQRGLGTLSLPLRFTARTLHWKKLVTFKFDNTFVLLLFFSMCVAVVIFGHIL